MRKKWRKEKDEKEHLITVRFNVRYSQRHGEGCLTVIMVAFTLHPAARDDDCSFVTATDSMAGVTVYGRCHSQWPVSQSMAVSHSQGPVS